MKTLRVARRYAAALMLYAEETRSLDSITRDLEQLDAILKESRELRSFFASPIISEEKKTAIVQELFGKRLTGDTLAFVRLLISKRREEILPDVIGAFFVLRDEKLGIVRVDVTSAVEVSSTQESSLRTGLERYTGRKVRMQFAMDKAIKGGLVMRIGDTVLDASITRQLELLKKRFVEGDAVSN
jgi:F-type H+-transporting ATPase subunit delta